MGNTRDTGYLQNLLTYDSSGNIILPANLTVNGNLLVATQSYVTTQISNLINGAPALLDTLDELAAALGDDANFASTITTSIAGKQAQLNGTGFVKVTGTTISYDNSTYLTTSSASSTYQTILSNPVTGSGTTNYLPKFTGSTTIGNSQVFDNGTNVGIGTASPLTKLMVQDSVNTYVAHFSGLNQANGIAIGTNSSNVAVIQGYTRTFSATNNIAMQVDGGLVGIGTNTPSGKLDVRGSFRVTQDATHQMYVLVNSSYAEFQGIREDIAFDKPIVFQRQGGNVLIGTTSDNGARLQVSGRGTFIGDAQPLILEHTGNVELVIKRSSSTNGAGLGLYTGATHNWLVGTAWGETSSNFIVYNVGTGTQSFKINYSSNAATFSSSVTAKNVTTVGASGGYTTGDNPYFSIGTNAPDTFGAINSPFGDKMRFNAYHGFQWYTSDNGASGTPVSKMIMTSSGNVLIGTTTDGGHRLLVNGTARFDNPNGITLASSTQFRQIYFDGFSNLYFWNGSNQSYLSSAGTWVNASDISIKKDIKEIKYALSDLLKLKPKSYKMVDTDLEQIGFIAQDVENIIPELVGTDNKEMKSLNYGNMVALLVKAVQELKVENDLLKARLDNNNIN